MQLIARLPQTSSGYKENYNLAKINWFQVGGNAEVLFRPQNEADLQHFLSHKPTDIPITIIGVGSNIVVRDKGVKGVVIRLGKEFANIEKENETIIAGAVALDLNVAIFAKSNNIAGSFIKTGVHGCNYSGNSYCCGT